MKLVIANVLLAIMFVFAISNALANVGFSGSARDLFYYGSTLAALAVLVANIVVLARLQNPKSRPMPPLTSLAGKTTGPKPGY